MTDGEITRKGRENAVQLWRLFVIINSIAVLL